MFFVGFADNAKGFRCINPDNKKLVIARDVKFLEDTPKSVIIMDSDDDLDSVREVSTDDNSSKGTVEEDNDDQDCSFHSVSDHEDEDRFFKETLTPTNAVRRSSQIPKRKTSKDM